MGSSVALLGAVGDDAAGRALSGFPALGQGSRRRIIYIYIYVYIEAIIIAYTILGGSLF